MRPWMGAAAVAAAMLLAPSAASPVDDDPALIQFQLPSAASTRTSRRSAWTWTTRSTNARRRRIIVSAWVTDQQLALAARPRLRAVGVVHDKYNIDRIRAERDADDRRPRPPRSAR